MHQDKNIPHNCKSTVELGWGKKGKKRILLFCIPELDFWILLYQTFLQVNNKLLPSILTNIINCLDIQYFPISDNWTPKAAVW